MKLVLGQITGAVVAMVTEEGAVVAMVTEEVAAGLAEEDSEDTRIA